MLCLSLDLIELVLDYSSSSDLFNVSLTCHLLSGFALRQLWKDLDSLVPILGLLDDGEIEVRFSLNQLELS
jgi:hypothetical protein